MTGPGGYGKTTCVASYIQARDLPCLWFQVDSGDADLATFFYYLGLAGKKAAPRKRKPLPVLTPEYMRGIPEFSRNFFAELFNRLQQPAVLVFDNYHEVADDAPLHGALLEGLARIPERVAVILVSRRLPPPDFSRVRANRMMSLVGRQDLRFTLDEFKDVVKKGGYAKQGDKALREIHARMDGWIAGLHLLLENPATSRNGYIKAGEDIPQEIFDYFVAESFSQLDKETRDFLLKTAWLPNMTSRMARTLTVNPRSGRILSYLYRNNFYTEKRLHSAAVYQYHPIFREFLLTHAKDAFSQSDICLIQKSAAELLEESGQTENAVELYAKAGEWKRLVQLILKESPSLIAQGRNRTLEKWLNSLPKEILDRTPWLLYWTGMCRLPLNPADGRKNCEKAYDLFRIEKNPIGLFISWSGVVDSFLMERCSLIPLDRWIKELEGLLKNYPDFPSPEIEIRVTISMFGALIFRQPMHPALSEWETRARQIVQGSLDFNDRIMIGNYLLLWYYWTGELPKAQLILDTIRPAVGNSHVTPLALITWRGMEALYCWLTGQNDTCRNILGKGLETAETYGFHGYDSMFLAYGAYSSLSSGEHASAKEYLGKMALAINRNSLLDVSNYHYLAAWKALLEGDPPKSLEHLETAIPTTIKSGAPFVLALYYIGLTQVLFESDRHREAAACLAKAQRIGRQIRSHPVEYQCLLAKSQFAIVHGTAKQRLTYLKRAFSLAREKGFVNMDWCRPSIMATLCARALESEIEVEYVQEFIRKRNLVPDTQRPDCERWPWPLKIYTLGRFELARDGKTVRSSGKAQQKPLALLKALIAFGGRQVSEGKIVDALWPNVDGDMQRQSLATTLHRLRKLLGIKDAIEFQDGKATLNPHYCWVDAWAFERLIKQADLSWKDNNESDNAAVLTEKAIGLFKGPFLSEETDEPWSIQMRERLRDKFLRGLVKLGKHLEQVGQWEEAIEQYQNGLAVDPLVEECYQRLMSCYHSLGRAADAVATYQRCQKNLETVLGVAPSPETEKLYQKLRSGEAAE